jgi:hypothetical protein
VAVAARSADSGRDQKCRMGGKLRYKANLGGIAERSGLEGAFGQGVFLFSDRRAAIALRVRARLEDYGVDEFVDGGSGLFFFFLVADGEEV